ncbi:MAG: type II secretion system F family protein [Victivallaceae bacterium]
MALYRYKASDAGGVAREITIEADSPEDSLSRLRSRGMVPLKYLGVVSSEKNTSKFKNFWRKEFNVYEFTDRLAPLMRAHIPLERALKIISESFEDESGKEIVVSLRQGLHEGKNFSDLIRSQEPRFPKLYGNLLEAGEKTGCIPEVVTELHKFLGDSKTLKDFLITSSIYPIIVLLVTAMVVILLFTVFIPKFARVFMDMGKELPLPTKIMLEISNILTGYWWLWLALIVIIVVAAVKTIKSPSGRVWIDKKILMVPVLGQMFKTVEMNRFVTTIAILMRNHVPILDAIDIGRKVIQNSAIYDSFSNVTHELKSGAKLSDALRKSQFMPIDTIQLLRVGEESGNLGDVLTQAAEDYERKMKVNIRKLLALFEPVVILIMATVILFVVISIFLAIFEMSEI